MSPEPAKAEEEPGDTPADPTSRMPVEWSPRNYIGGVLLLCLLLGFGWTMLAAGRDSNPDFECGIQREHDVRDSSAILVGLLETKREVRQAELAAIDAAIEDTGQQITELRDPAAADLERFIEEIEAIAADAETAAAAARTAGDLASAIAEETRAAGTAQESGPTTSAPEATTESDDPSDDAGGDSVTAEGGQTTTATVDEILLASDLAALTDATTEADDSTTAVTRAFTRLISSLGAASRVQADERAQIRFSELLASARATKRISEDAGTAVAAADEAATSLAATGGGPAPTSIVELLPLAEASARHAESAVEATMASTDAVRMLAEAALAAAREASVDAVATATTDQEEDLLEASSDVRIHLDEFQALETTRNRLDEDRRRIQDDLTRLERALERATLARERGADDSDVRYRAQRSTVVLEPQADDVTTISLGSSRSPRRTEIVLLSSVAPSTEPSTPSTDAESAEPEEATELPDVSSFLVTAGQFQRGSGIEIDPASIEVWAHRVAQRVVVSVCITPDSGLNAGRYQGTVSLVDPSLPPVHIPVEITAQAALINNLYGVLFLAPALAFGFIWITGRHTADADPLDKEDFLRWTGENLLLCFGVGIASVWATLQVPFNDPTWGSSVPRSAAIVAASVVAAITAMTAVVGKARFDYPARRQDP